MNSSFMQRKERAMETWKVQIMNQKLHWQARPWVFPQHLEAAAKSRSSTYLKGFSTKSIPLTRLESIKLQVCLSLDTEEAQTFKVFYYLSHRNNHSSDSEQEDPCLQDVLNNAAASRTSQ